MDGRIAVILHSLQSGEPVTAEELASELGVTARTVRTIMGRARDSVKGARVVSRPGSGYVLSVFDPQAFAGFMQAATEGNALPQTPAERVRYLLELLLSASGYIKLEEIAESLFVSRKTLAHDLRDVEAELQEFHLMLDRKPYHGIRVVGAEVDLRHCLANHFQSVTAMVSGNLGDVPMEEIARSVLAEEQIEVSSAVLRNLVVHLRVALLRVSSGNILSGDLDQMRRFVAEGDRRVATELTRRVAASSGSRFPESEIEYLALHLAGKRILLDATNRQDAELSAEASRIVRCMLAVIDQGFGIGFTSDQDLVMSLTQHVMPLIIRLRFGMHLANPVLTEVREKFPLAYLMAAQASGVLEHECDAAVSSDEIAYIALWLALSLERRPRATVRKRVLLVCASGQGTAKLLEYKYRERFGDLVASIATAEVHRLASVDFSQVDVVFSTVPIEQDLPVPVVQVHTFPDDSDIPDVRRALLGARHGAGIAQYFDRRLFFPHLSAQDKHSVLAEMVRAIGAVKDIPGVFLESVLKREALISTDIGNGVAMPHTEVAMTPETFVCVALLDTPVRWTREDVSVIFLTSIENSPEKDLQGFYRTVSKFLLNKTEIESLLANRDFDLFIQTLEAIETERSTNDR